jgi:hypothetical protein
VGIKRSRIKLPTPEYRNLCQQVYKRDGWKCRCCRRRNNLHAHHIVFRSQGGDDADYNMITLCDFCHSSIHKPHPFTGACLVLLPVVEDQPVDANGQVKFFYVNNWQPRKRAA